MSAREVEYYRRMFFLAAALLGVTAVAVFQLASLQLQRPPRPPPRTEATFEPVRGNIYDRNGYLLAVATTVYDIAALPGQVKDKPEVADRLAPLFGDSRDSLLSLLQQQTSYVRLKRGVTFEVARVISDSKISGLQVEPRPSRVYPNGPLAACVLGFVTEANQASHGVEAYYNDKLGGKKGFRIPDRDAVGALLYRYYPVEDGVDLYLTIDRNIQAVVEESLAKAVTTNQAQSGVVIVMDPKTGAILAMAVFPAYDPNVRDVSDESIFTNSALTQTYEPGSVFKVLTIASALDASIITPSSTYYDGGQIIVGGRTIKNSDGAAHGETTITDLLAYSLNVGAAQMSTKLGAKKFYEYVRKFGFGRLTGVDLAHETAGWVRAPGDPEWHESDLATNSFGQGLAATPLQMLCAISAVANRGVYMHPYVVGRIVAGNSIQDIGPRTMRPVVSPEAAAQVTDMLVYAVDHVQQAAAIPGYRVAGKSGTSEVWESGAYSAKETVASFAGYVPADDPRFSILVVLDHPQKEQWGVRAAAPAFREIALKLLQLMGVPPDSVRASLQ
jgi:cell division protein FtsI/penicillin-binding protein 2